MSMDFSKIAEQAMQMQQEMQRLQEDAVDDLREDHDAEQRKAGEQHDAGAKHDQHRIQPVECRRFLEPFVESRLEPQPFAHGIRR